ncbi:NMD3 family [Phytophthora infestans]|uniref:60S ribosomal export protein NMD3 n=1 Tax=Phytophthora infestans TaxID=4787 RepID=A0A833S6F7_PHYIN|nr:NMD3 family [Phytophthora infestans]
MSTMTSQMPTILCCMCATPIVANAANTCVSCLKSQVDVTEGIPKEVIIHQCRGCMRWSRPPWVAAELESRELLAMCLKKINNLNRVKLIDANWIWTEPHSRRLKLKLTVQKEVLSKMIMQQSFVVTFVVRNQQCDACQASFANQSWRAVVQVRQRVDHKRTFFFLEQLILKHRAHEKTTNIESHPDGVDFFFSERNHALRFVDFLQESVPMKVKTAKKLISADNHSNTHNYKFTYAVEIAPVCKDDLVLLPVKLARMLGNMSCLCLVQSVTSSIHVVDPFTTQVAEVDSEKYWRYPFRALRSIKAMTDLTVLDSNPMAIPSGGGRAIRVTRKTRLADMEVVRDADFGVNDTRFRTVSHLGMLLHVGDSARGYDLTSAVFNDADLVPLVQSGLTLPDVVLVKKIFPRRIQKRARNWKLKKMEGVEQAGPVRKADLSKEEQDYEQFMDELEEDKEMRSQINLYKDETKPAQPAEDDDAMDEDDVGAPAVELHELLDDLAMKDDDPTPQILSETEANQTSAWELEEL